MRTLFTASAVLLLFPAVTFAQTFQGLLVNLVAFLSSVFIPFLLGIAFLFFIINVIRFFVFGSTSEEGREKAKMLAIFSVLAFVLIITFWGIINLIASSIGLEGEGTPVPDIIVNEALQNPTCTDGQTSVCYETYGVTVCRCE